MYKNIFLLTAMLTFPVLLCGQQVDSIKVEQAGDFIRIGYSILESKPGQVYRVRVLSSINGGLNSELRSVSGDVGDNVQGGKDEYFIVWDVLKDVDELISADFIVRAELVNDVKSDDKQVKGDPEVTLKWSKKRINALFALEPSGPKVGIKAGYLGSFGLTVHIAYGPVKFSDDGISIAIGSVTFDEYESENQFLLGASITKRIVNYNGFQMHLAGGVQRTRMVFFDSNASQTPYHLEKVFGPEFGIVFGIKTLAMSLTLTHFDPGQVEKDTDFMSASPLSYVNACIGVRF